MYAVVVSARTGPYTVFRMYSMKSCVMWRKILIADNITCNDKSKIVNFLTFRGLCCGKGEEARRFVFIK